MTTIILSSNRFTLGKNKFVKNPINDKKTPRSNDRVLNQLSVKIIKEIPEKDLVQVNALMAQLDRYHAIIEPDFFEPPDQDCFSKTEFHDLMHNENIILKGAYADERLVGFVCLKFKSKLRSSPVGLKTSLYIDPIVVDLEFQEQGIGRKLLNFANAEAIRLKCDQLSLHVWEGNQSAREFYSYLGFETRIRKMSKKISYDF